MDDERLKEIRARLEAATPGPWEHDAHEIDEGYWEVYGGHCQLAQTDSDLSDRAEQNAALIAHAPTDIADLCDALDEANLRKAQDRALIARLMDALPAFDDETPEQIALYQDALRSEAMQDVLQDDADMPRLRDENFLLQARLEYALMRLRNIKDNAKEGSHIYRLAVQGINGGTMGSKDDK